MTGKTLTHAIQVRVLAGIYLNNIYIYWLGMCLNQLLGKQGRLTIFFGTSSFPLFIPVASNVKMYK